MFIEDQRQENRRSNRLYVLLREQRSSTMVEFAIIAPVFLLMLFLVFQVAYQQYLAVVLQATVQNLAHLIETGQAENQTDSTFLTDEYCPNTGNSGNLLGCSNLFIRIQHFNSTSCSDLYNATQGTLPVDAGGLELGLYFNVNGVGKGNPVGPTGCSVNTNDFCNAGPAQTIILTGIYVSPSLIMGLIPGSSYQYNNSQVVAEISSVGFETEGFAATSQANGC